MGGCMCWLWAGAPISEECRYRRRPCPPRVIRVHTLSTPPSILHRPSRPTIHKVPVTDALASTCTSAFSCACTLSSTLIGVPFPLPTPQGAGIGNSGTFRRPRFEGFARQLSEQEAHSANLIRKECQGGNKARKPKKIQVQCVNLQSEFMLRVILSPPFPPSPLSFQVSICLFLYPIETDFNNENDFQF